MSNGPKGRTHDIYSEAEFGDCVFHCEFMVAKGSNSGVYFASSYELQILDSFAARRRAPIPAANAAAFTKRWDPARGKGKEGYEGHSPKDNVSKKPGEWQTFDVIFHAPKFDAQGKKTANAVFVKVLQNGTLIHENVELNRFHARRRARKRRLLLSACRATMGQWRSGIFGCWS